MSLIFYLSGFQPKLPQTPVSSRDKVEALKLKLASALATLAVMRFEVVAVAVEKRSEDNQIGCIISSEDPPLLLFNDAVIVDNTSEKSPTTPKIVPTTAPVEKSIVFQRFSTKFADKHGTSFGVVASYVQALQEIHDPPAEINNGITDGDKVTWRDIVDGDADLRKDLEKRSALPASRSAYKLTFLMAVKVQPRCPTIFI